MSYTNQAYLPSAWRLDGAGADVSIKVLNNNAVESVTELVKKLAGNSALPERHPGFGDWVCQFTVLIDGATAISDSGGGTMRAGNKGTLRFPIAASGGAPSRWFHVHVMLIEVNWDVPNDDLLQGTVKVGLDCSSNAQGQASPFVYPS